MTAKGRRVRYERKLNRAEIGMLGVIQLGLVRRVGTTGSHGVEFNAYFGDECVNRFTQVFWPRGLIATNGRVYYLTARGRRAL